MLMIHQLWQSGLWILSAALNGFVLFSAWVGFAQVRRSWFWKAALFLNLAITSVAVIWIGDPNLLYALPVFLLLGLLSTQGPRRDGWRSPSSFSPSSCPSAPFWTPIWNGCPTSV